MKVLFIAVHPDDETLGCGGTILKHKQKGDSLFWLIISELQSNNANYHKERRDIINSVSKTYKFNQVFDSGFSAKELHNVDFNEIISKISEVINDVKPDIIYTPNRSDVHTDHQIVAKAVASCTKTFRNPFIKRILMYECLSESETNFPLPENAFIPNVYSDITPFIDQKIDIMKLYKTEIHCPPLPRSPENIRALARFRGSLAGIDYAEAFMLLRDIF